MSNGLVTSKCIDGTVIDTWILSGASGGGFSGAGGWVWGFLDGLTQFASRYIIPHWGM